MRNLKYIHQYIGLTFFLIILLYAAPLFASDATLSWDAATTKADETSLTDPAGYIVYYGTATGDYSQSINVGNVKTHQITNLTKGFTYYFIVTAYNKLQIESEASLEVSKTIPLPDITPPTATITSPTSGSTFTTNSSSLNIGGTASDNVGVTQAVWSNSRGGSGAASGTTSWSVNGIALQSGTNVITVTAGDAAGNTGTDTLTVTYNTPVSAPTFDDFSIDTTWDYTVIDTWTSGGVGSFLYDSIGQRAQVLTGDNIGLQFSHALSPLDNGTFSIDYLPTVKYPAGGFFYLRLVQDADNYYELFNTDGYGPQRMKKVVGGVVVDSASFVSEYSQNNNYLITISFSPDQTTVDAFGEILVMNTDTSSILVNSFEVEIRQQDAYVDNVVYNDYIPFSGSDNDFNDGDDDD